MKWMLITLVSVAVPYWVSSKAAQAQQADEPQPRMYVMTSGDPKTDGAVWVSDGQSEGDGKSATYTLAIAGDAKDGRSAQHHVLARVAPGDKDAKDRPWMGIQTAEVPESLRVHLSLEGGVMIGNVTTDSPADQAGLKQYDIITTVDGNGLKEGVSALLDQLREHRPGDTLKLSVVRDGRDQTALVTLASWAEAGAEWKFMATPDSELHDRIRTRGKIIRKDDQGNYVVENLGDITDPSALPADVLKWIPNHDEMATKIFIREGKKTIESSVERDGVTITVSREDDGPITVTRTDQDGKDATATYDTPEALAAADPEAHDVWQKVSANTVIAIGGDGSGAGTFAFDFKIDDEDLKAHAEEWKEKAVEWREQLEKHIGEAQGHHQEALKQLKEHLQKLGKDGDAWMHLMPLFGDSLFAEDGKVPGLHALRLMHKPKHSFEVASDGSIEVRIRKGDGELVRKYASEDDLANRDPELYDKYVKLMEADDEKE